MSWKDELAAGFITEEMWELADFLRHPESGEWFVATAVGSGRKYGIAVQNESIRDSGAKGILMAVDDWNLDVGDYLIVRITPSTPRLHIVYFGVP